MNKTAKQLTQEVKAHYKGTRAEVIQNLLDTDREDDLIKEVAENPEYYPELPRELLIEVIDFAACIKQVDFI